MVDVARRSHGIAEEGLIRQTAAILGVTRLGANVRSRLAAVLTNDRREGDLTRLDGMVRAG